MVPETANRAVLTIRLKDTFAERLLMEALPDESCYVASPDVDDLDRFCRRSRRLG